MTEPHLEIGAAFLDTPGSLAIFPSWGLYIEGSATQCLKEQAQNISCSLPFESYKIMGVAGAGRLWSAQSVANGGKILSLTVVRRKNRCIPCVYWGSAIFAIVLKYSNLFLPFTFFLYGFHFAFCYKLIVCSKTTAFMKCIRNLFAFIQWDESLFLYFCKIHCL